MAPKPALANTTSRRPKRSSAAPPRLLVVPLGDVAADDEDAIPPAQVLDEPRQAILRPGREREPVAGLGGPAGGRLADPARGAGDEHDGLGHEGTVGPPTAQPLSCAHDRRRARAWRDGVRLKADVCVVGSGAAGLALIDALQGHGLRIVVLESGAVRRHRTISVGASRSGCRTPDWRTGGSGLGLDHRTRAGQCIPLDPGDFEVRLLGTS